LLSSSSERLGATIEHKDGELMSHSPYLKSNRLADVIAAIQFMAMNERSSLSCNDWAKNISGGQHDASYWRTIFEDHTEFFRKSPDDPDHYALIWRRALPRRYYRHERRMLAQAEFDALSADQRKWVSRPPVPEAQIKTLVDIAITLHARQDEQHRDWRWWVPIVASFVGSLVGAIIGIWGVGKK
jgi:hypothetical protein